jgi:hypothetical protein
VEVPYFLSKYDPDPLRFYLTATAPETRDTEFSWEDFVERNNNELVATHSLCSVHAWGNARADSGPPEGTRVHAELCLQALRRGGTGAGGPFEFLRAGLRRRGPGAPGEGRDWLPDGWRAVQRLPVPCCSFGVAQGKPG